MKVGTRATLPLEHNDGRQLVPPARTPELRLGVHRTSARGGHCRDERTGTSGAKVMIISVLVISSDCVSSAGTSAGRTSSRTTMSRAVRA